MNRKKRPFVNFVRPELTIIMAIYGRMVAAGEWRDYGIDALSDRAVFSIFRHASEMPLYRVEKIPVLARRQGQYQVLAIGNQILKRSDDLKAVLKVFDTRRFRLVSND